MAQSSDSITKITILPFKYQMFDENDAEVFNNTQIKNNGLALQAEFVKILSDKLQNSSNVLLNDFLKSNRFTAENNLDTLVISNIPNQIFGQLNCQAILLTSAHTFTDKSRFLRFVELKMTLVGLNKEILWEYSQSAFPSKGNLNEEGLYSILLSVFSKKIVLSLKKNNLHLH